MKRPALLQPLSCQVSPFVPRGRPDRISSAAVRISKPGFQTQTLPVTASANGWYIAGTIVFGGLIGWFVVDPFNGKMYNLSPESINSSLAAGTAHNNTALNGGIAIMLIEDVPAELRRKMVQIN